MASASDVWENNMQPTILYEDDDILAVNKPAGLVVHSDGKTVESTLADWVLANYPDTKHVGEPARTQKGEEIVRPGIVHRLDRETSGVMLVAKTARGFDMLKKQFQEHEITKEYHAFLYGELKGEMRGGAEKLHGVIDRPIGRSAQDFRKWSAQRGSKGERREAVTEYDIVSRGDVGSEKYTFVHAYPLTGRTHQIRVHFKAVNYPLVADSLYSPKTENTLGFKRLALHSYQITFTKTDGIRETVTAAYPEDFKHALALFPTRL
jgi:23S rRNA pseudouridine1911/1915/1917 synthase